MGLVPVVALQGPYDGRIFHVLPMYPLIPDSSLDEPGWWTDTDLPMISGQGYYVAHSPTEILWVEDHTIP